MLGGEYDGRRSEGGHTLFFLNREGFMLSEIHAGREDPSDWLDWLFLLGDNRRVPIFTVRKLHSISTVFSSVLDEFKLFHGRLCILSGPQVGYGV